MYIAKISKVITYLSQYTILSKYFRTRGYLSYREWLLVMDVVY